MTSPNLSYKERNDKNNENILHSINIQILSLQRAIFCYQRVLIEEGHTLTRDWLPRANLRITRGDEDILDIKEIYQECMHGIREAELVVVEDTVSNFSTGHQITMSLQWNKPTLVLWSEPKHDHFRSTFLEGVESDYLTTSNYSPESLEKPIMTFINKYKHGSGKHRFHLVISEQEKAYLEWKKFQTGKSVTKLIRQLIRQSEKTNSNYQKYLSHQKLL